MDTLNTFNLLLLGGPKVGKKKFLERILTDDYSDEAYVQSLGIVSGNRESIVSGSKVVAQIIACSGRKRHLPIVQQFYDKIHGALIPYDVTSLKSFATDLVFWYNEIKRSLPSASIVLVGTKIDGPLNARKILGKDGLKQAEELGAKHFEVSSKSGKNVEACWTAILEQMILDQDVALGGGEKQNTET